MSSSAPSRVFAIGVAAAGLAAIMGGCSTDDGGGNPYTQTTAGTTSTSGASTGTAGSTSTTAGTTGMGGSGTGGTTGNAAGTGTTAGSGTGGSAGAGTAGAAGAGGGTGGGGGGVEITKVWPSDACGKGMAAPAGGKHTIMTSGTKAADCAAKLPGNVLNGAARCGDWGKPTSTWQQVKVGNSPDWDPKTPLPRDYWITYPQNYDPTKAYPLVLQGPGCGSEGSSMYSYGNNANNSVIFIGISPPNRAVGHGSNPGEGCFDDKEGDDSVDWVLYETLYDDLNKTLCFDRNRLFSGGNSSGAWFSNELGCKYAGDATRPVRGIMPNTGGLPEPAAHKPTCTDKPMSGMWIHSNGDTTNPFSGNKYAIARAMLVNKCTMGNNYDNATKVQFPNSPTVCKLLQGCPEIHPLVVCEINANDHDSHNDIVNPGVSTYLQMFQSGKFLTQ
jgi:poly(3-hydroxybutyrate) depolymerase